MIRVTNDTRNAELLAISWVLARRQRLRPVTPEPEWAKLDSTRICAEARRHRSVGLILSAPDRGLLPSDALTTLALIYRQSTLNAMAQAADLQRILNRFEAARIPALLAKGQAFSSLVYGDWAVRGVSADADLLIPPKQIGNAHRVMLGLGYHCDHDEGHRAPLAGWRGRYNRWLHHERSYMATNRLRVDVHWRPVPGSAPWTHFDALWSERAELVLHGRTVQVPGPRTCLRLAAGQGEPDGWPTLRGACDVIAAEILLPTDEVRRLRARDPLVAAATTNAPQIILRGNPNWSRTEPARKAGSWRREWLLRARTDNVVRAAARSALGNWLPARTFMPMDAEGVDHPERLAT